jgi:hypothetical protein
VRRSNARRLALGLALGASGCLYQFTGGNFPEHIRTLAVDPIINDTPRLELTGELQDRLVRELPRSLGIRPASTEEADAIVRVRITSYQVNTPNYRPGAVGDRPEVLQRQVMITAQVQIVDQVNDEIYWEDTGLRAEGQFLEASETEEVARDEAIELLVQRIVDGAQSNW